jgi:hypothetical protein
MMTIKWVNITMMMISSQKKNMNVEFQHTHEAALGPLIIKRINVKIVIVEMIIKT